MPRRPRAHLGDGIFHVIARGNRRQDIFLGDRDYMRYLTLVGDTVRKCEWRCGAFALMPNHVHFLVECRNDALSLGMHHLQGTYAQWFNHKYRVDGHVFQDRFHAWLVRTEANFFEDVRYVVLNPFRAGLCKEVQGWPWTSFLATAGLAPTPKFLDVDWILRRFSADVSEARQAYGAFVRAGVRVCPGADPVDLLVAAAGALS